MNLRDNNIGIIAGGGKFPFMVAEAAKKQGFRVVAVAHKGETDTALDEVVDDVTWINLGQLGKLINTFKDKGIKKALMAGTISKERMFGKVKFDLKGISLISRLAIFHDDNILRAVADQLAKDGIEIISSTEYLPELLAPKGYLTKKKPGKKEKEERAWRVPDRNHAWRASNEEAKNSGWQGQA